MRITLGSLCAILLLAGCGDAPPTGDDASVQDLGADAAEDASVLPRLLFASDPTMWFPGNTDDQASYSWALDANEMLDGKPVQSLSYITATDGGYTVPKDSWGVAVANRVAAKPYRDKCIRMSARIKTDGLVGGGASMWLRYDEGMMAIKLANGISPADRRIKGTQDWTPSSLVLQVPDTATHIAFGVLQFGEGKLWISDVKFEEVPPETPESPFHEF
jgi:hypothetical protein